MADRRLISSGSPFEAQIGYSRAVVAAPWVFMSGTTGFDYKSMTIADTIVEQAEQCFRNVAGVLEQAGVSFADVVRITYLVTRREDFEPIWPVLQRYLGEVRPACTVIVAQLLDPRMLIEVEVTAFKP
ncbi:MAG: RidA family protein [Hyphomicrobium sp.]|jgi:enamine deaminase RidA (YjgF/YER057c/UK114 family)